MWFGEFDTELQVVEGVEGRETVVVEEVEPCWIGELWSKRDEKMSSSEVQGSDEGCVGVWSSGDVV